jgi:hypothetical protein
MKKMSVPAAALAVLLSAPAIAVEAPKYSFLLWSATNGDNRDLDVKALLNQDIKPNVLGIETLGLAQSCAISAADANGKIAFTFKMSFTFKDATGTTAEYATATPSIVTTARFPDPRLARFQCGGANQTQYGVDGGGSDLGCVSKGQTPLCQDYPQTFNLGIGIATKGTARFVVIGSAARGDYQNNIDNNGDWVDFSRFNISTYDSTGARVMTKNVTPDASGFRLIYDHSSVGDYLNNGTKVDEIRLVYYKATATVSTLKYLYYDVQSGALLDTAVVDTNCLGPCRQ